MIPPDARRQLVLPSPWYLPKTRLGAVVATFLGFGLVVVTACSSGPESSVVPTPTDPTPVQSVVVDRAPSVTSVPTPVPDSLSRSLGAGDVASLTEAKAGERITDASGNLIAVNAVRMLKPQDRLDSSARLSSYVAIDISMCDGANLSESEPGATPESRAGDGLSFSVEVDDDAALSVETAPVRVTPIVAPMFRFPGEGGCSRGWLEVPGLGPGNEPVDDSADLSNAVARYVLQVDDGDGSQTHVYQWSGAYEPVVSNGGDLDGQAESTRDTLWAAIDGADQLYRRGQTVTFNQGVLADSTVVLDGWAELFDAQSRAGTRPVGVLVQVCGGVEADFALAVDGWYVIEPSELPEAFGQVGDSQGCGRDWVQFEVPFGLRPTGFSVSDGADTKTGFAAWSLEGAAIAAPDTGR